MTEGGDDRNGGGRNGGRRTDGLDSRSPMGVEDKLRGLTEG